MTRALLLLLAACRNDPPPPDDDDDGFNIESDCDDTNPDINPDADEVCDGVDQDCDGDIDEDAVDAIAVYVDGDADGYGDDLTEVFACALAEGQVDQPGDCDDTRADVHVGAQETDCEDPVDYNCDGSTGYADVDGDGVAACEECDDAVATTYPGAPETCNEVDDDCDLEVDENATDAATWSVDADGDTYGRADGKYALTECDQPEGYVADATDCDDSEASINPLTTWYADTDGDTYGDPAVTAVQCETPAGYVSDDQDCDDSSADVNPETVWYGDTDGDGHGRPKSGMVTQCEQPSGYAASADDCNDADGAISPAATEVCDNVDNDCNGTADDDYAADALSWYADDDGDGFGSVSDSVVACEAPSGYGTDTADCDGGDTEINPDAEDVCSDAIDQDCDSASSFCGQSASDAAITLLGDSASDEAGGVVRSIGDFNNDGNDDLFVTAMYDASVASQSGAAYIVYGPLSDQTLGSSGATFLGEGTNSRLGNAAGAGSDFNNDGDPDIALASLRAAGGGSLRGEVYFYWGGGTMSGSSSASSASDFTLRGATNGDRLGGGVAFVGDVDGDSVSDIVVGAEYNDAGGTDAGAFYLVGGGAPSSSTATVSTVADARIAGTVASGTIGNMAMGLGDVDGDGVGDFVLASSSASSDTGEVWLFYGPVTGNITTASADLTFTGESAADAAGTALATIGDLTGDGLTDWVVGAPAQDFGGTDAGAVYLMSGALSSSGSVTDGFATITADRGERFGSDLSGAADLDGDGQKDLLVGSSYYGVADNGAAWLFLLDSSTSGAYTTADARARFDGAASSDLAGGSVGLFDLDGTVYVGMGASGADINGVSSGAFYLLGAPTE